MKRRILLKETMTMARTGDTESFKSFYILTVSDTFGKVFELADDRQQAEDLLVEIYLSLYHQADTLPIEEDNLNHRIEEEIYRVTGKGLDSDKRTGFQEVYGKLNEERAATLWMRLEEEAGFNKEKPEEDEFWKTYLQTALRITAAVFVLVFSIMLLMKGWDRVTALKEGMDSVTASLQIQTIPASTGAVRQEIIIEEEKLEQGWRRDSEQKLYYIKKDGVPADGQAAIGKQIMTFSRDGELLFIGNNPEVAVNMNLSFDEDIRYEVRNGNVYQKAPDAEERCVIRNGHVIQADVRCGYLWYVCQYQIPNSEEIKTTVSRALPDGEMEEEVYSTRNVLDVNHFQVTSDWYYYLLEGRLFRKNLTDERTEYLAEDIEYYFAWEDTVYYMKNRSLETVSAGYSYSGVEAGYQIERKEAGFVLLDSTGAAALESGNGEIQIGDRLYQITNGVISSVSPAARKDGNITYFIDESGAEAKIYWKDEMGTGGLLSQEGLKTDAFCIAGEWLYYSAQTAQYGGECQSQIYRTHLNSLETEPVGQPFRGKMQSLYYFDNVQAVYGEYIPSLADPQDIHGSIAKISIDQMGVVNDTAVRPEADGSDMLELVMVNERRIYCLYHRCSYDAASGQMTWESTEPLEIELPG